MSSSAQKYEETQEWNYGLDPELRSYKKKLSSGDYFGEVAFLYDCKRTATVKAKLYATVGTVSHEVFAEVLREFPDFKQ